MLRGSMALLFLSLLAACGCNGGGSERTFIMQYPQWDWEQYERIAVVPFRCPEGKPGAPEAARQATYMLEDLLAANGNFTVLERDALAAVLTEQDLSQLADIADPSTILPPGKVQIAQALIVGKITEFDTDAQREERRRPVYARDRKGRIRRNHAGHPIVVSEEIIQIFRHEGTVAGSVRLIDAATGKVIFVHKVPSITRDDAQRGAPPRATPGELAIEAAKELAVDCYTHVAPIRTEVKLKSSSLLVALDYYDGEYDKTKKIPIELDSFLLVVRKLPQQCDRNSFRVALAPEDGRNIFEEEFVWSSHNPVRGKSWKVPVELLKSAGAEKFVAKLYSGTGEEPILDRDFKLDIPDEDN
jgi:hypothetical protein